MSFFKLLLRTFDVVGQLRKCKTYQQKMRPWKWKGSWISNVWNTSIHDDAKMIAVWNVKKLTATRTKMEVRKLRTLVEQWCSHSHQTKWGRIKGRAILISEVVYQICNILVSVPWWQPSFCDIIINVWKIKTVSPKS